MMHAYLATLLLPSTATCAGWNSKRRCYQRKNNRPWLAYGKYRFTSSGLRFTPKRGWQLCVWPGHYSHIITPTHAWQGDGLAWPMLTHYHKFPCMSWQLWAGLASTHTSSHLWIQNVSLVRGWSHLASDHTLPLPCMLWEVPVGLASTNTASLACMLWQMWGGLDNTHTSSHAIKYHVCVCFGGAGGRPRQCEYIYINKPMPVLLWMVVGWHD